MLIWTSFSIYHELTSQKDLPGAFDQMKDAAAKPLSAIYLVIAVCMMPLNWLLETLEWYLLLNRDIGISFRKCMAAVLGGLALSMNTPNRVGEYFGRILYLEKGKRLLGANYSVLSGLSQLLMTLTAGLIALQILPLWYPVAFPFKDMLGVLFSPFSRLILLFVVLTILFFYFNYASVFLFLSKKLPLKILSSLRTQFAPLEINLLFRILSISLMRFMIFTTQYLLIWKALGINFDIMQGAAIVSIIYLIMAIIPTIAFAELGIRGKVALWVAGLYTNQVMAVATGTVFIWLINLM
ncbi:MAG: lysylphosphatidylglycerol synthase domain-containing protein, partial [Bacteroidota bacterium]